MDRIGRIVGVTENLDGQRVSAAAELCQLLPHRVVFCLLQEIYARQRANIPSIK
jgi:hypothetical protein